MNTQYFTNCQSLDEAKNLFRNLCKQLHPDKGGNAKEFIKMYNEFKAFKPSNGQTFNADKFYNMLQKFDVLQDIKVSFVGNWIWLEDIKRGATYTQKGLIKNIDIDGYNGARFASKKKAWYFSPEDYVKKSRKNYSLDSIKNNFGSTEFKTKGRLNLNK